MTTVKLPPDLFSGVGAEEFVAEFGDKWHPHPNKTDVWWLGAKVLPVIVEWKSMASSLYFSRLHLLDVDPGFYFENGARLNYLSIRYEFLSKEELREYILAKLNLFA